MSWSYLFFSPSELPLTPETLSEDTARAFTDSAAVQAALSALLPHLVWAPHADGERALGTVVEDGTPYEFSVMRFDAPHGERATEHHPTEVTNLIVSMRCSGRVDSSPFAQRLCDALGWIAFDDRADLFQPHYPPMPGGGSGTR